MGLFGKKDPCAICGGAVKGLFPPKIEKQLICRDCYGNVDLPDDVIGEMTIKEFKEYMAFRKQNALLKEYFSAAHTIDLGLFSPKIVIDTDNCLFCMDSDLEKTIFEGGHIVSFTVKEDYTTLFEGNSEGLRYFESSVPESIRALSSQIKFMEMNRNIKNIANAFGAEKKNDVAEPHIDLPNPFEAFNIEIQVDHPYWSTLTAKMSAPTISGSSPDLNSYMREYKQSANLMEELANALMEIAFSAAPDDGSAQPDAVDVIRRFKELLDQGIITEEEFAAKKRQLLGI